ncbi:MAG: APC family permease [Streptosporangiaceae bacterium]
MTREARPASAVPVTAARSLRRDSIAFVGTAGSAVGIQAPSAGVSFLPALMAGIVGAAGPFAFGTAMLVMLFVAFAFVIFTREFASAGSAQAFNGAALGPAYGFVSAWLLLFTYLAYAASVFASNANGLLTLTAPGLLGTRAWLGFAAGLWLVTIIMTRYSIRFSTGMIFALEAVSLALVAVVAVAVLARGGYHGVTLGRLSWHPFSPAGVAAGTLGLGVVFAFTGFSGFEVAATLGEESKVPTRVIPWSMTAALIVSGVIYTALSYVETVAYPSAQALAASAAHGVPLASVAGAYLTPGFGTVITVAAVISGFGAQLATVNGATRLLFASGRSGVGPAALARVHPVHRTPTVALAVTAAVTLAGTGALWFRSPLEAFTDLATYGADLIIVAYLATIIAALAWTVRRRNDHRSRIVLARLVLLAVGAVAIGYVIKVTVYPLPSQTAPRLYLYAAAATIAAGVIIATVLRLAAPGRLRSAALLAVH